MTFQNVGAFRLASEKSHRCSIVAERERIVFFRVLRRMTYDKFFLKAVVVVSDEEEEELELAVCNWPPVSASLLG